MATISAAMVKDLREKTGAPMMDCKQALNENNGDIDAAVDWLRKKGLSKAAKKAGRVAAEGLIGATRPAFLAALDRPFLRSQSTAASMSPWTSVRADLQSIMPAPVCSRSSFTIAAVMFDIALFLVSEIPGRAAR